MLVSVSEFTNSGEGYIATIFIIGAYAAPNPALTFFFFFAMKSALPPEGKSIRYAYACPFNGGKQAEKECQPRKRNTLILHAATQRKTEWMSLNAGAFNLSASLLHFVHVRQPVADRSGVRVLQHDSANELRATALRCRLA